MSSNYWQWKTSTMYISIKDDIKTIDELLFFLKFYKKFKMNYTQPKGCGI